MQERISPTEDVACGVTRMGATTFHLFQVSLKVFNFRFWHCEICNFEGQTVSYRIHIRLLSANALNLRTFI